MNSKAYPQFVVFEGLDGAGKSSLIQLLVNHLQNVEQVTVCTTREPGGTPLAEKIRGLLLEKGDDVPVDRVELLLYGASRAQHVEKKIRPALATGQWVLCDRFTASTVAFQHHARGLERTSIDWLNEFAIKGVEPAQNILLDLPMSEAQRRTQARGGEADRMESESMQFHERVRQGYLAEAKAHPQKWLVLDALQTPAELFEHVLADWRKRSWIK